MNILRDLMNELTPVLEQHFALDMYQIDNTLTINIDMPGFTKEAIELAVDHNVLNIKATRKTTIPDTVTFYVCQRQWGTVNKEVALPWACTTENIAATLVNGVLTITINRPVNSGSKINIQ